MTNNPNKHRNSELQKVKKQLASSDVEQRVAALSQVLQYGEEGLELAIAALKDKATSVQQAAYSLISQSSEPRVKSILQEYDPLLYRRGIECFDVNDRMVLVLASIEQVAQTLERTLQVEYWQRDVYGCQVKTQENDLVIFQFCGHSWSVIHAYHVEGYCLDQKDAHLLARLLQTRAIYYRISDTGGFIEYHLYDGNELVERLYERGGDDEIEDDQGNIQYVRRYPIQFQSRRQIEAKDIENAWSFTTDFFIQQDVYIPRLWRDEYTSTLTVTLKLEGIRPRVFARKAALVSPEFFKRDDFDRVDYMVVK